MVADEGSTFLILRHLCLNPTDTDLFVIGHEHELIVQ